MKCGELGVDPWEDSDHTGKTVYLIRPGNASGSPMKHWGGQVTQLCDRGVVKWETLDDTGASELECFW